MRTNNQPGHLDKGIRYFGEKDLPNALTHFLNHLKDDPANNIANKAAGVIYFQKKDYKNALQYLLTANHYNPGDIEILNLIGASYMESKQYIEAHNYFNLAIENNPEYLDGIFNLGLLYYRTNNYSTAINAFSHLLGIDNSHISAKTYIGLCREGMGEYRKAIDILYPLLKKSVNSNIILCLARCYIALNETDSLYNLSCEIKDTSAVFNLANFLLENNLAQISLEIYNRLIPKYNDKASLINNIASAYDKLDNVDQAISHFKKCIEEYPDFVAAYSNIGRVLGDINQPDDAIIFLKKGLTIDPENSNAYINLGRAYEIKGDRSGAYNCYAKALEITPNNASALYNIGNIYQNKGQFTTAIEYYKKCLLVSPGHFDAEFNLGITELTTGDFSNAWGHYFKRNRVLREDETLSTIIPGTNYHNKKVYLRFSQGLGDELLFLRFLPGLKSQGAHIIYRCQKKLFKVLESNPHIDELINQDDSTPLADYYFCIDDLPLILGMSIVDQIPPALTLLNDRTDNNKTLLNDKFEHYPRPYIGITWRAGTHEKKTNFKNKETYLKKAFPLNDLIETLKDFKGTIFILQRNPSQEEFNELQQAFPKRIVDTSSYNEDLFELIHLLNFIDDSICVSNTNVHILAGLNKTCNVLIPFPPEWRWMDIPGNSPWFPNMDTFRQSSSGNWDIAIDRLREKLHHKYGFNIS